MKKVFVISIITLMVIFFGVVLVRNTIQRDINNEIQSGLKVESEQEDEIYLLPEEVLELLIANHRTPDSRKDKGYSYIGVDEDTGYYLFNWANQGKGTGAGFSVDPYTGDVYSMGKVTSNLLESLQNDN